MPANNTRVETFRQYYRQVQIPKLYSGWIHGTWIMGVMIVGIVGVLQALNQVRLLEWLTIPVSMIIASHVEYLLHRHLLHKRFRFLAFLYRGHTMDHHNFYNEDDMHYESTRDWATVFFPFFAPPLILGLVFALGYFIVRPLFNENTCYLLIATGYMHYLFYEVVHFFTHIPDQSPWAKFGPIAWLRHHHALHHDPARMTQVNFNITPPLCDWIYGTLSHEPLHDKTHPA